MKKIKYVPCVDDKKDAAVKNQIIEAVNEILYRDKKNKCAYEVLVSVSYSPNQDVFSNLGINLFWTKEQGFFMVREQRRETDEEKNISYSTRASEGCTIEWGEKVKNKVPPFKKSDAAKAIFMSIVDFIETQDLDGKSEVEIVIARAEIDS